MKRYLIHTLLLVFTGTTLLACRQDRNVNPDPLGKDKAAVSLVLNLPQREQQASRATDDEQIDADQLYLLVFDVDADGKPTILRERAKILPAEVSKLDGIVSFTTELTLTTAKSILYVVANFDAPNTAVGASLADVQMALKTADLPNDGAKISGMPSVHPMISEPQSLETIELVFALGSTTAPVKLYRNTVKINASTDKLVDEKFVLESIALYNAPVAGYVFPNMDAAKTLARYPYAEGLKQTWDPTTKRTGEIVCYEAPTPANAAQSPFVVIKGTYDGREGYYRVDFMQRVNGILKEVALLRNCIFTFDIKNVQRAGYATIAEAIQNTASNAIVYNVLVGDLFSSDIISNGEQYLGVSNSELVVHSDRGVQAENVLAVTVSYTKKINWTTPGTITCSAGITLIGGAEIVMGQNSAGTYEERDIYISLADGFQTGNLTVSIGDLHKKITVRRSILPASTPMTYDGGFMEITHQQETTLMPILLSEVVDPHVTTWIRLATSGERGSARSKIVLKHDITGQPSENLYVHVWGNEEALYTSNAIPKGYFFVSYANDRGRTRYCVVKEVTEIAFNANGGHGQPSNLYEWVKQRTDNNKAYVLLPQIEPMYDGFIFKGWTKNRDGSGSVYQPNTLYETTFAARDELYAQWKVAPVVVPYIKIGERWWSVGNLVADGAHAAKVGASTDKGLMFKFGSLIGFDRTALTATLKPVDCSIASPDVKNTTGVGYTNSGALPADNSVAGVGDPCRFYLGGTWRLPEKADYDALRFSNYVDFTITPSISGIESEGVDEKGASGALLKLLYVEFYRENFSSWESAPATMYRTTSIATPLGFEHSGTLVTSTTGLTDSHSLGAVRCVRNDTPNPTPVP